MTRTHRRWTEQALLDRGEQTGRIGAMIAANLALVFPELDTLPPDAARELVVRGTLTQLLAVGLLDPGPADAGDGLDLTLSPAFRERFEQALRAARAEVVVAGVPPAGQGIARAAFVASGRIAQFDGRRDPDEHLSPEARELIEEGVNERTRQAYNLQWRKFLRWCGETGRQHLPAAPATVVEWITELGRRPARYGRPTSPASVTLSLRVITAAHRRAQSGVDEQGRAVYGFVSPVVHHDVQSALKAYTQRWLKAGHRPDRAHPLRPAELARMIATCPVGLPHGIADATLLAVGYDLGARRVELAGLDIGDVLLRVRTPGRVTTDDSLVVTIPMSKTDQEGRGADVVLWAHPEGAATTCPVRWMVRHLAALAADGFTTGALFRVVKLGPAPQSADGRWWSRTQDQRIDKLRVEVVVKRTRTEAGLPPELHIVPHSLRAGAATEAGAAGASNAELNDHFRWSQKGTTANTYVRPGLRQDRNVMRKVWTSEADHVDGG